MPCQEDDDGEVNRKKRQRQYKRSEDAAEPQTLEALGRKDCCKDENSEELP